MSTHAVQGQPPSDDAIQLILKQRIDEQKRGVAIVVGWVDENGSRVVPYGRTQRDGGSEVDGKTMFEIGSVSKVFTSLLLADAVEKGEVRLDDPVGKFLPPEAHVPTRNGKQITLLDLATHRSGLPRLPTNLVPKDEADPYVDYTPALLYAFLSGYTLPRDIGAEYEYSNLGVGLLGHALANRTGKTYEQLLAERITQPLGLTSTGITLTKDEQARLALPYKEDLSPAKNWNLAVLAGAGGIRSDVDDMLRFVADQLDLAPCPLSAAMRTTQQSRFSAGSPKMDIGLGWHIDRAGPSPIVWHNGGTGGYRSYVGFDPAHRCGVVVLANSENSVDDIGAHLLNPQAALSKPPEAHNGIALKPEVGQQYVGHYALTPGFIVHVSREGDHYFAQATGQGRFEIFPEAEEKFFAKMPEIQMTFVRDAAGNVASMVLRQGGVDRSARRLSAAEEDALPKPKTAITIKPEVGDRYVGKYQVAPGKILTFSRVDDHYFAQLTGQSVAEVFPSADNEFFWKIVDAAMTFQTDGSGKVTSLVLHQHGDLLAKRLP